MPDYYSLGQVSPGNARLGVVGIFYAMYRQVRLVKFMLSHDWPG
jgi:hypothetical protein